jgi:large subunit ribosomal protein L7/L12
LDNLLPFNSETRFNLNFFCAQTRLNISEIAMPVAAAAAPAPAAAAPAAAEAPAEKTPEKTMFSIKLESFAADAKAKVIREIKNIVPGINLVDVRSKERWPLILLMV